ncbi:MAG: hypothetical protein ACREWE_00570, partial [Gammaproteobacteria bacterium]
MPPPSAGTTHWSTMAARSAAPSVEHLFVVEPLHLVVEPLHLVVDAAGLGERMPPACAEIQYPQSPRDRADEAAFAVFECDAAAVGRQRRALDVVFDHLDGARIDVARHQQGLAAR